MFVSSCLSWIVVDCDGLSKGDVGIIDAELDIDNESELSVVDRNVLNVQLVVFVCLDSNDNIKVVVAKITILFLFGAMALLRFSKQLRAKFLLSSHLTRN